MSVVALSVRDKSKLLFGNSFVIEVCAAVADAGDRVNLTALTRMNDVSSMSLYSGPLHRLVRAGLLVPAEPQADDDRRERWFSPQPSSLWLTARELSQ